MKARRIALVSLLGLPALACQLILGIDDHDFNAPSVTTDADSTDAADTGPRDLCAHAGPPTNAEGKDLPNMPAPLTFALRTSSFSGASDAAPGGYDLDNACTCDPRDPRSEAGPTCLPSKSPSAPSACDGDGGVDNAAAAILSTFQIALVALKLPTDVDGLLSRELECGRQSLILVLENYNGQADDPDIRIRPLVSYGIREAHDGGEKLGHPSCPGDEAGTFPPGSAYPAKFDESDFWTLRAGGGAGFPFPGWVRGFKLVSDRRSVSHEVIPLLLFGGTVLSVSTPVLTGDLVPLDSAGNDIRIIDGKIDTPDGTAKRFRIRNGELTGRASSAELLEGFGKLNVNLGLGGPGDTRRLLCSYTDVFPLLKQAICDAVDVHRLPFRDYKGEPCDALSIVLRFEASPASVRGTFDVPEPDGGECAPGLPGVCP
jgi:hypothetical protein